MKDDGSKSSGTNFLTEAASILQTAFVTGRNYLNSLVRQCPFCGAEINLSQCPIVSLNDQTTGDDVQFSDFQNRSAGLASPRPFGWELDEVDDTEEKVDWKPSTNKGELSEWIPSTSDRINGYKVLIDTRDKESRLQADILAQLRAVKSKTTLIKIGDETAPFEKSPRRLCTRCLTPLPLEMDTLKNRYLAIAGVTGAGKSHYITQSLYEATRQNALEKYGVRSIVPISEKNTDTKLQRRYLEVLRNLKLHPSTQKDVVPDQFILSVNLNGEKFLLITHDISGEAIEDSQYRAEQLTFLRRANAFIFFLDPGQFEFVYKKLPKQIKEIYGNWGGMYQVDLLHHCLEDLKLSQNTNIPIEIVISKSDLLSKYADQSGIWSEPGQENWKNELEEVSESVQQMLKRVGQIQVVELLKEFPRVVFHAVSALGGQPMQGSDLTGSQPLRCDNPLGAALYDIVHQSDDS